MRIIVASILVSAAFLLAAALTATAEESMQDETQKELIKFQGLWQTAPGGMEHRAGKQVVRNPALDGPCFFVHGDRLLWLDQEGKPTGKEETITLDLSAEPKRVTLTPVGENDDQPTHGIYVANGDSLTIHLGLDGGPAPKQFLELNKPVKGNDGLEWLVHRKQLQGK